MNFDDMNFDDVDFDNMDFDSDDTSDTEGDFSDDFNDDSSNDFDNFDDDYEFQDIDYSNFENKIVRIVTKDIGASSGYKLKDLYGDICIIHKYDAKSEAIEVERLGKMDKLRIEIKYIEQVTGAKLNNETKELLKIYRKSHSKMVSSIKKILNARPQEEQFKKEIQHNLYMIGQIAESTYEPIQDNEDRHSEFDTYGGLGRQGSYYDNSNKSGGLFGGLFGGNNKGKDTAMSPYDNRESKGFFGSSKNSNRNNSFGGDSFGGNSFGDNSFGDNSFGGNNYGNSPYGGNRNSRNNPQKTEIKNGEGMKIFQKNIFGQEKAVYERSKNGKRKKKPTQMMKSNKLYYVKLYSKDMMVILVKQKEISPGYYDKYYYSEFGLIEPKEIVWFREKAPNERGFGEIKRAFDTVFRLENKIIKLNEKMALNDKIARTEDARKVLLLKHLHKIIGHSVKRGTIPYQSKSKINLSVATYQNIRYIIIKGLEPNIAKVIIPKHNTYIRKMSYKSEHRLLMIPLIKGNRYTEMKIFITELIELLGNEEKYLLKAEMNNILDKLK